MTPGQAAYEEDCRREPFYPSIGGMYEGRRRRTWNQLGEVERWSWERNPTVRAREEIL